MCAVHLAIIFFVIIGLSLAVIVAVLAVVLVDVTVGITVVDADNAVVGGSAVATAAAIAVALAVSLAVSIAVSIVVSIVVDKHIWWSCSSCVTAVTFCIGVGADVTCDVGVVGALSVIRNIHCVSDHETTLTCRSNPTSPAG